VLFASLARTLATWDGQETVASLQCAFVAVGGIAAVPTQNSRENVTGAELIPGHSQDRR
jgi:hypothetical protein